MRTYGRVAPADHLQAAAVAALLQAERVKRVFVVDDRRGLRHGARGDGAQPARGTRIRVAGRAQLARAPATLPDRPRHPPLERRRDVLRRHHPERRGPAVEGGAPPQPATEVVRARGVAERRSPAGSAAAPPGARSSPTRRSTPLLPAGGPGLLRGVPRPLRQAPEPYAIYGYEAMSVVLDAIRRAGRPAMTAPPSSRRSRPPATATRCSAATRSTPTATPRSPPTASCGWAAAAA